MAVREHWRPCAGAIGSSTSTPACNCTTSQPIRAKPSWFATVKSSASCEACRFCSNTKCAPTPDQLAKSPPAPMAARKFPAARSTNSTPSAMSPTRVTAIAHCRWISTGPRGNGARYPRSCASMVAAGPRVTAPAMPRSHRHWLRVATSLRPSPIGSAAKPPSPPKLMTAKPPCVSCARMPKPTASTPIKLVPSASRPAAISPPYLPPPAV